MREPFFCLLIIEPPSAKSSSPNPKLASCHWTSFRKFEDEASLDSDVGPCSLTDPFASRSLLEEERLRNTR